MRRSGTAALVVGLAFLGLMAPTTSASAGTQDYVCASKWPGRDGYVRAWQDYGCDGGFLGQTRETTASGATTQAGSRDWPRSWRPR